MKELARRDVEVTAAVRNVPHDTGNRVRYVEFDLKRLNKEKNYFEYFGRPDLCIHLAWEGLPNFKEAFHINENLPRHVLFLENMIRNGLKNLTVTGTCLEYGLKVGELTEEVLCDPVVSYGEAKLKLFERLAPVANENNASLKWLRLFYMYGDGQNEKSLIPQLERALQRGDENFAMSGGEQQRDFLPVEKIAAYIVSLALKSDWNGITNVCSGRPQKVKDFVNDFLKNTGRSINLQLGIYPYPDYEPMAFWGSTARLNKLLTGEN
jgi:dTDP-6-deoxy-L-talose 4-dehydrogenase (NAD+)